MKGSVGRLGAYALVVAGIFAFAFGLGRRVADGKTASHDHGSMVHADHGGAVAGAGSTVDGVTLRLMATPADTPGTLRFEFFDDDGTIIKTFAENHGALVHLLVIRSDLAGFQHLHPTMNVDGTWSTPLSLDTPGVYHIVTDVRPESLDGPISPTGDVVMPGLGPRLPLPAPDDDVTTADGLRIVRDGFVFAVSPSDRLEPYLGAPAHLVGFREGDRAYLHLHAMSGDGGVYTFADPPADATGRWRFFLQFGVAGEVVTQAFTVERGS